MPGRTPVTTMPYPASYALLAFFAALLGLFLTTIILSDAISALVPPAARVQFRDTGHAAPGWAAGVLLTQEKGCFLRQPTCTPAVSTALGPLHRTLLIGLLITIVVTFTIAVVGLAKRTAYRNRRPPIKRSALFRLYIGKATGILSAIGHGAAIAKGARVFLSGDDLCQNTVIFGGIGSGKTSSAINRFVRALLALRVNVGMLVFDVKGDFGKTLYKLAAIVGRDVTKIGVGGRPINLLADLSPEMAASFLKSVLLLAGAGSSAASIYLNTAVDLARNTLGILSFTDDYSLKGLYDVVYSERMKTLVDEIEAGIRDEDELARFNTYAEYLKLVFPRFEQRIKNGARTTLSQILDAFKLDEIDKAFCRSSPDALTMNEVLDGRVLLMDLPIAKYGLSAKTAYTMVKLRFFNVVDRRRSEPTWNQDRPVAFVCDEYQEVISVATDAMSDLNFWDKSRSARCAGIISAQGFSSFRAVIGDDDLTEALLQNFRQKITFRSEDPETIKRFAFGFGKIEVQRTTDSRSQSSSTLSASSSSATSRSVRKEEVIDPQLFRSQLPRGRALCTLSIDGDAYDDVLYMPYYQSKWERLVASFSK